MGAAAFSDRVPTEVSPLSANHNMYWSSSFFGQSGHGLDLLLFQPITMWIEASPYLPSQGMDWRSSLLANQDAS